MIQKTARSIKISFFTSERFGKRPKFVSKIQSKAYTVIRRYINNTDRPKC